MWNGAFSKVVVGIVLVCAAVTIAEPARLIYVDAGATGAKTGASWADAYNYLQDALAAAAMAEKPVEIRVAKGVYKPDQGAGITPGDQTATFQLLNGVTLKGGYAGAAAADPNARDVSLYETVLSGDLAGNDVELTDIHQFYEKTEPTWADNSWGVVTGSGTDATAGLDGFTITAGRMLRRPLPRNCPLWAARACATTAAVPRCSSAPFATTSRSPLVARCTTTTAILPSHSAHSKGTAYPAGAAPCTTSMRCRR